MSLHLRTALLAISNRFSKNQNAYQLPTYPSNQMCRIEMEHQFSSWMRFQHMNGFFFSIEGNVGICLFICIYYIQLAECIRKKWINNIYADARTPNCMMSHHLNNIVRVHVIWEYGKSQFIVEQIKVWGWCA